MTISPCSGRILGVFLTCGTLLATPLHAGKSAARTQELTNPEPAPPELKQAPKTKESINEPPPNTPARSLILTVKLAFLGDQRTAPCMIEVDTKWQDVVLSGKVSSEAEKLASVEVARQG